MNLLFWKKKQKSKIRYVKYFLYAILAYLIIVIWPVKGLLMPSFLFGNHLVIFTNEAEARPCGGFVTAFGEVSLLPPKFNLKNSYYLEDAHFGLTTFPLSRVAEKRRFWDLGDTSNLSICSKGFQHAYEQITNEKISQVILLDLGTVESILSLLGSIEVDESVVEAKNFFSTVSRTVANVDRHDEKALSTRKTPLSTVGKSAIKKIVFRPWIWWKVTRILSNSFDSGAVYNVSMSPEIKIEPNDFVLTEWNLGGGKSSRFLDKTISIAAREYSPDKWVISLDFLARHLGGEDEPVSQVWKGVFELTVPTFFADESVYWETQIKPGGAFMKHLEWKYEGVLSESGLAIFIPRGQRIFANVDISHLPQVLVNSSLNHHENVLQYRGYISGFRQAIEWEVQIDNIPPFITMHEVISPNLADSIAGQFPEKEGMTYFYAEIHFNELVSLNDDFSIVLEDRDFTNMDVTEQPTLENHLLLKDKKTLLLQFSQTVFQRDERYYLKTVGVEDMWGNMIESGNRTLITR